MFPVLFNIDRQPFARGMFRIMHLEVVSQSVMWEVSVTKPEINCRLSDKPSDVQIP